MCLKGLTEASAYKFQKKVEEDEKLASADSRKCGAGWGDLQFPCTCSHTRVAGLFMSDVLRIFSGVRRDFKNRVLRAQAPIMDTFAP